MLVAILTVMVLHIGGSDVAFLDQDGSRSRLKSICYRVNEAFDLKANGDATASQSSIGLADDVSDWLRVLPS
jgi:hypothetical protein